MTANNAPPASGSGWSVESQTETTQVGPGTAVTNGITVGFVTGLGVHGTVFVPRDQYNPARVREAILAAASQLDAVASMTHEG